MSENVMSGDNFANAGANSDSNAKYKVTNATSEAATQAVAVRLSQEVLFFPIPFTDVAIENVVQIRNLLPAESNSYSTNVIAFKALSAIRHRYSVHPPVGFILAGGAVNLTFSIDPKIIMRSGDPALRVLPTKDSHDAIYLDFAIVPASDVGLLQRWNYDDRDSNNGAEVQEDASQFWKKHGPATGRSGVIATSTSTGTAVMRKRLACVFGTQDEAPQSLVMKLKAEGKSVPSSVSASSTTPANISSSNNMSKGNNNPIVPVCNTNNASSSETTSTQIISPLSHVSSHSVKNNSSNPTKEENTHTLVQEKCYVQDAAVINTEVDTNSAIDAQNTASLSSNILPNAVVITSAQPTSVKTYTINATPSSSASVSNTATNTTVNVIPVTTASAAATSSSSATSLSSTTREIIRNTKNYGASNPTSADANYNTTTYNNNNNSSSSSSNNKNSTSKSATSQQGLEENVLGFTGIPDRPLWKQVMDFRIPYQVAIVLVIIAILCGMLETNSFFTWLIAGKES